MLLFQPAPKISELVRAKIREDFAIDIDHRSEFLARKADHLVKCSLIGNDIDLLVFHVVLVEPMLGLVTPATVGFDE